MKEIGRISSEGMGGEVYETPDGKYYYTYDAMYLDENDDEQWRSGESEQFSSLDELVASLPTPSMYRSASEPAFSEKDLLEVMEKSRRVNRALREIYAAEGLNRFQ